MNNSEDHSGMGHSEDSDCNEKEIREQTFGWSTVADMMAISGQTYRSSPYSLPPPGAGRITSRPVPYSSPTFPLQQQYNLSPPANNSGLSFQNSMLLPGLQAPSTTSSLQLPDSPSHDSAGGVLPTSGVVPRRHSTSSHGSPLPPSSPIMEEESSSTDQYKSCSYRSSTLGPVSMNATMSFNSFSSPYHNHHSMSLPMPSGMGYHPNPPSMCPSPMYTTQDSMCSSVTQPLSISPMCYPTLPSMNMNMNLSGNSMTKLSLDTPRYKLTPERAIPLIKWFEEHKEHPYPTRHEKMLLCQSTQLTYTQVSTWFANARRRMKKANSEEEESRSNHSSSDEQNSLESPIQPS